MPLIFTDEEVLERGWDLARRLGHSRDEFDGMLAKATPREVLRRLDRRYKSSVARAEREDAERWATAHAAERREVFMQLVEAGAVALYEDRARQTLAERVERLLMEAAMCSEGTKATALDGKITQGEKVVPMPTLNGRPLVDEVREILDSAIERAEAEVDFIVRKVPRLDWFKRNEAILGREGPAELVALRFGVSESHVRKLRASSQKVPANGRPARERTTA